MAQLNVTASEIQVTKQRIQSKYARIELLNNDLQVLDSLEAVALNGSLTIDANSDMRRSATIKFVITDSSFEVDSGGKIWLDKLIRVYLGTESIAENQIIYTNIGTFVIDAPTYEYDAVNNSIQLSLLDLMCKLSGLRDGYLPGVPVMVSADENIRQAMIDTLALGGFTKYICDEAPSPGVVPNDLSFAQGSSVYTVLAGLRDIYPNYEIFFDVDGVFHYQAIPTGENEPVQIDDSLWESVVISEKVNVDFQYVKNFVEVFGRTHEPAHFATAAIISGSTLNLTIAGVTEYTNGMIYGFTLTNNTGLSGLSVRINDLTAYPLCDESGASATIEAETGTVYYCIQYTTFFGAPRWKFLGHLQAYGFAMVENPDSPFYVNGSIGEIRLPLYGGDYENCTSDDLATQRAQYELYMRTNMQDSITLTCIPVPWLDVNTLVQYTVQRNNETRYYLIKSISFGFDIDDTMTVTMVRYYPGYTGL